MDISQAKLFNLLKTKLAYLGERQSILSQNIANANTPGYTPKDLKPLNFEEILSGNSSGVKLSLTEPGHMTMNSRQNTSFKAEKRKDSFETTLTGNKVSLEEQMMQVGKVNMDYQATTNVYRKMLEMLRTAMGG